jgi:hypothetical protein
MKLRTLPSFAVLQSFTKSVLPACLVLIGFLCRCITVFARDPKTSSASTSYFGGACAGSPSLDAPSQLPRPLCSKSENLADVSDDLEEIRARRASCYRYVHGFGTFMDPAHSWFVDIWAAAFPCEA